MAMHINTRKRHTFAFVSAIVGSIIMMLLVLFFNRPLDKKIETVVAKSRIMDVKRESQVKQAEAKPESKPEQKQAQANNNALPNVGSMLGGIAMNIPELSFGGIMQDAASLLEQAGNENDGGTDTPPKVVARSEMEYPSSAAKEGLSGYVVVNLLIDTDGNVEMVKILESQPSGVFDEAATRGVRNWKFTPGKSKGKPVKLWAKQKIKFN